MLMVKENIFGLMFYFCLLAWKNLYEENPFIMETESTKGYNLLYAYIECGKPVQCITTFQNICKCNIPSVSQSKRLCVCWATAKAMARPLACQAIAYPFVSLYK